MRISLACFCCCCCFKLTYRDEKIAQPTEPSQRTKQHAAQKQQQQLPNNFFLLFCFVDEEKDSFCLTHQNNIDEERKGHNKKERAKRVKISNN